MAKSLFLLPLHYPFELAEPYLFDAAYKCFSMNTVDRYGIFPVAPNTFLDAI